jgi:hypothetical protein
MKKIFDCSMHTDCEFQNFEEDVPPELDVFEKCEGRMSEPDSFVKTHELHARKTIH